MHSFGSKVCPKFDSTDILTSISCCSTNSIHPRRVSIWSDLSTNTLFPFHRDCTPIVQKFYELLKIQNTAIKDYGLRPAYKSPGKIKEIMFWH